MKNVTRTKHNLHTPQLFDKIRKRLKVTEEELPDKTLKIYFKYLNSNLLSYIMDNPEGFQMTMNNQLNGVIAISKHLPKEMREDKFETLEYIQNLDIPDYRKKVYLKRYNTALNRRIAYASIHKDQPEYQVNAHSFFYAYKIMWFNKRNCKIKKTMAYEFQASIAAKEELEKRIRRGEDFFELNFDDFYHFRIKPIQ